MSSIRSIVRRAAALVCVAAGVSTASAAFIERQDWKPAAQASFDLVWKTVAETFHDPTFGGLDWAAVRTELQPRLDAARRPDDARDVIREMLRRLGRSHFTLISAPPANEPWPGFAVVPIDVRILDAGVVVTRVGEASSAFRAGIRPGDVVLAIDGDSRVVAAGAGLDRQQRLLTWQRVFRALHGPPGSTARLSVRGPSGDVREIGVPRGQMPGDVVTLGNLPPLPVRFDVSEISTRVGTRVGVIAFTAWMTTVAEPFAGAVDRFREADGIIVDLRGNPGGLAEMIRGIAGHFLAAPDLLGRVQMRGVELEMRANPRRSTSDGRRVEPYAGPLAVIVDEMTASASECFAGGLQSLGRARIFGVRTAGQALPASTRDLPNGDVLLFAVGDFVTSTGVRLEGAGVVPDVEVPLSVGRLAGGRDPVMAAALEWVDALRGGR